MRKIVYMLPLALLLLSMSPVLADNYTINVSFFTDSDATQPYINEFLYVYARHKTCQSYYLGGINCTYDCRHGRYASGTAIVENITGELVWDFYILQPASFDNETACPRKINSIIDFQFDQKIVSANGSYDYLLNETVLPKPTSFTFDWTTWLVVGYWVLVVVVVVGAGYFSNNGWVALIVFVIMVIIKLLLF